MEKSAEMSKIAEGGMKKPLGKLAQKNPRGSSLG
jgi:hypothetical protein